VDCTTPPHGPPRTVFTYGLPIVRDLVQRADGLLSQIDRLLPGLLTPTRDPYRSTRTAYAEALWGVLRSLEPPELRTPHARQLEEGVQRAELLDELADRMNYLALKARLSAQAIRAHLRPVALALVSTLEREPQRPTMLNWLDQIEQEAE
jgi:hypothetical protein